ncbi:MAG: transcription antitermination factor NusB [Bacillota bacterium]
MGRRQAREAALRTLYQVDVGGIESEAAIKNTTEINETLEEEADRVGPLGQDDLAFAREIIFGTIKNKNEIDSIIAGISRDWNVERLARVDHNIMRMAVFEIMHRDDIPFSVTVNEAVDLAKTYGSDESGKFVNGILGMVTRNSKTMNHVSESNIVQDPTMIKEEL